MTKRIMKRKRSFQMAACMPTLKVAMGKNAKHLAGYTLATTGMTILQNVVIIELIRFISDALGAGERSSILPYVGAFISAYLAASLLKKSCTILNVCFTRNVSMEVEQDFIKKYSGIRYRDYYFEPEQVLGQARANGINAVGSWCTFLTDVIWRTIAFLVSVIYLSSINIGAVILCIVITVTFMILSHKDNLKLPPLLEQFNGYMAQLYAKQWEQIKNHRVAGFLNLDKVALPYRKLTDSFIADLKKIKIIYNRSTLFASFGTDIIVLAAAILCALLFSGGNIQLSGILVLLLSIPNVSNTLFSVPSMRNAWQQSMGGLRMMDEVYLMSQDQKKVKYLEAQEVDSVEIRNFSFCYRNQEKQILDHLNLHMECGIHLLKGASGCGKSTVLRILAGELPILSGTLKLGKQEITAVSGSDFGAYVEYMSQIPVVVKGTFQENILMGKEMNRQKFDHAVHSADLTGVLENLPEGEQSVIFEDVLSSGEKQKIALARVFYQDKPIWILDEPTSALDPGAIRKVMKGIAEYAKNRVVILSSHQSIEGVEMKVHYFEGSREEVQA